MNKKIVQVVKIFYQIQMIIKKKKKKMMMKNKMMMINNLEFRDCHNILMNNKQKQVKLLSNYKRYHILN